MGQNALSREVEFQHFTLRCGRQSETRGAAWEHCGRGPSVPDVSCDPNLALCSTVASNTAP